MPVVDDHALAWCPALAWSRCEFAWWNALIESCCQDAGGRVVPRQEAIDEARGTSRPAGRAGVDTALLGGDVDQPKGILRGAVAEGKEPVPQINGPASAAEHEVIPGRSRGFLPEGDDLILVVLGELGDGRLYQQEVLQLPGVLDRLLAGLGKAHAALLLHPVAHEVGGATLAAGSQFEHAIEEIADANALAPFQKERC